MDFDEFIDSIATKFGYDDELVSALKRCVPAMAKGKNQEDIKLLKDALERVEIVTFDKQPTREDIDELKDRMMAGRNSHVTFNDKDRGYYGKVVAPASYRYAPIFDENMNIVDRVSFIYVTNLSKNDKVHEAYGTMIDLSKLIHEIGHAWASQKDEYIQNEDGSYIQRTGTAETRCEVDRKTCTITEKEEVGLYLEEALNSIEEENALCTLLGVEKVKDIPGYSTSTYQWKMTEMVRLLSDKLDLNLLEKWRFNNDKSVIKELNELFRKTEHFERRKTDEYCEEKKAVVLGVKDEQNLQKEAKGRLNCFFDKNSELFYGKKDTLDFIEYFDSTLECIYNLRKIAYDFYDIKNGGGVPSFRKIFKMVERDAVEPISEMEKVLLQEQENSNIKAKESLENALKSNIDNQEIKDAEKSLKDEDKKLDTKDNK